VVGLSFSGRKGVLAPEWRFSVIPCLRGILVERCREVVEGLETGVMGVVSRELSERNPAIIS